MVHCRGRVLTMARPRLSAAHFTGAFSLSGAGLLALVDARLALIPLLSFVSICAMAPFLPRLGFFLPIISRGSSGKPAVAITFDDGPDPVTTPPLLDLLSTHGVRATFFVTGKKASENPLLVREILRQGHEVGNHSYSHDNFIMLKGTRVLMREIESTQRILEGFGIRPLAFRPPVGITNPRLGKVLNRSNMYNVNFSCRAFDGGNRWIKNLAERILRRVHVDAIIALHDVRPADHTLLPYWLNQIELILSGLRERGLMVLPLPELIGRRVMVRLL
ncbi:MAG: polysaccharide deacetylase family protein [Deltaproteobacteria bacterium]|nr:polysaccharide deacetylase family protein [Deltaproteobacteria bacterium]MBW2047140.1 polysaccharide deacetylase family protein [Deltaproteobacteria bacterium]MBW2109945.1 polysaccharide deacetylase family protein [Deltaproteobacteria bacterium]MBW2351832.1 polysaccharide deacetylase family protein [Deltaproteobacteria bacterium]